MDKVKHEFGGFWNGKCPGCGSKIEYIDNPSIMVHAESSQWVDIGNCLFLKISKPCDNPFCEWSKIESEVF